MVNGQHKSSAFGKKWSGFIKVDNEEESILRQFILALSDAIDEFKFPERLIPQTNVAISSDMILKLQGSSKAISESIIIILNKILSLVKT